MVFESCRMNFQRIFILNLALILTTQLQFTQQLPGSGRYTTERVDLVRGQQCVFPVDGLHHLGQPTVEP